MRFFSAVFRKHKLLSRKNLIRRNQIHGKNDAVSRILNLVRYKPKMILDFITINHTRVGIDCNNMTRSIVTFIIRQRNLVFDYSFKKQP